MSRRFPFILVLATVLLCAYPVHADRRIYPDPHALMPPPPAASVQPDIAHNIERSSGDTSQVVVTDEQQSSQPSGDSGSATGTTEPGFNGQGIVLAVVFASIAVFAIWQLKKTVSE